MTATVAWSVLLSDPVKNGKSTYDYVEAYNV